ncbi:MAG: hypothetical protein ACKO6Q_05145 [Bacteroidota bacterium]
MSRLKFLLPIILISAGTQLFAQGSKYAFTKRANLRVGANYNFQNGTTFDSLFQSSKGAVEGNIFLGYRFDPSAGKANYFGVFGALSSIQPASLNRMRADQAITLPAGYNQMKASVIEVQGGFIFGNWFRIAAGPGSMAIPTTGNNTIKYKYYVGTTGFVFNMGTLKLNMNASSQFGGDLKKNVWRAGIGLGFSFDFLSAR